MKFEFSRQKSFAVCMKCYAVAHAKNQLGFWHTKSRKQIRCAVETEKKNARAELLN